MADLLALLQQALTSRYRVDRELGSGGMAVVFLADDLRHRRPVALKVLRPELAAEIGPERFLREIETAARLTHPHILPVHDSGEASGLLYYVMPHVEGESLRGRLAREKQLPLDDALRIAREVADALSYAHSQDVVHRDIKPENILLQSGHAVVADFGIARAITAAGGGTRTATGIALGTPAYMSPEQAAGSRELDGRSDLYSLSCVLYEMLAGQPPFTGPTAESLAHQHLSVAPRPVSDLRPAVPGWVAAAIQRALAKTPADRFSSAAQFADALTHGEPAGMPMVLPVAAAPSGAATVPPGSGAFVAPATPDAPAPRARRTSRLPLVIGAAVVLIAAALLLRPGRQVPAPASPAHARSDIAVLPFQNLSADGAHAYFAGGLHDELLTQLAKVAALKVISRTSVMGYQGTSKPLKAIATELGVGSVVEGSVQVVGGRLRVNVQLIDAATDEHLWAERYDRTLDDAFAIQSEVAQRIVAAVGAALTSVEQGRLTAAPTANAEAYQFYLQGREHWTRQGDQQRILETALQLYGRALRLDPGFALARAELSEAHGLMYWFRLDPSPARAALQREEAEAALRLAPDLPQAHFAMGLAHYWGRRDYGRAQEEFAIALKGLPNDARLWRQIGNVQRRLGNWNEVLAAYEKASQLDPRDANLAGDLGGHTFRFLRRHAEAVEAYDRSLALAPESHGAAVDRGLTFALWKGELDTLRAVLDRLPEGAESGGDPFAYFQRAALLLWLWERNADGLLQTLHIARIQVYQWQNGFEPSMLYAAWAHQLRGDQDAARASFDSRPACAWIPR